MADGAECGGDQHLKINGDKDIVLNNWKDAEAPEEKEVLGHTAIKYRTFSFTKVVKGNPLVKEVKTVSSQFMIENSPTKFHMITHNKTYEAPYCDTFVVYQEILVLSPPADS